MDKKNLKNSIIDEQPLISIVTVVYNGEESVEETIQSVFNQTYENIEYIIIDGGSTDGTVDIIKKYEDNINYWVSEKDSGIYDAMNKGSKIATGDFIVFMNGGDKFFSLNSISIVKDNMDNRNKVYFARAKLDNNIDSWIYPSEKYNIKNMDIWLKNALPNHQTMFFPKIFYKKVSYNLTYKIGSDSDYKFKALDRCGYIFVDTILCSFNLEGISSKVDSIQNLKQILKDSWSITVKHRGIKYALKRQIKIIIKYILSNIIKQKFFSKFHKIIKG